MFGGGGRRREESPDTTDDPLAGILSKLGLGSEGDGSTVARDFKAAVRVKSSARSTEEYFLFSCHPCHICFCVHSLQVQVLVEVLEIDHEQAKFFLESAANDVAVAVNLHFELVGSSKRTRPAFGSAFGGGDSHYSHHAPLASAPRWVQRPVEIAGLPEGWRAFVSATTGSIVFENAALGALQNTVPAGFADPDPDEEDGMTAGAAHGGRAEDAEDGSGGMPGLDSGDADGSGDGWAAAGRAMGGTSASSSSAFPAAPVPTFGAGAFDFSPRATGGLFGARGTSPADRASSAPPAPMPVFTAQPNDALEGPLLTEGDSFDEDL